MRGTRVTRAPSDVAVLVVFVAVFIAFVTVLTVFVAVLGVLAVFVAVLQKPLARGYVLNAYTYTDCALCS